MIFDLNTKTERFRANYQDCAKIQDMVYIGNQCLVLFEREEKKMSKIHLVKLVTQKVNKTVSQKVDKVDTLILNEKKFAEKKISTVVSGQSLIVLLTDSKVKSSKPKVRFLTLIVTFKREEQQLIPMFVIRNEWLGELEKQDQIESKPVKKAKFACLQLKPDNKFFVYLGYGSDCAVFNPIFDQAFLSYLPDNSIRAP